MFFINPLGALIIIVLSVLFFLLPILALISILRNKFEDNDKLIWVIVVLLLPYFGSIIYFIIGRKKRLS
ncbi:PLDc N-terminal domain-containing protein [Winogradskyella alexanderae]|uniref:PLD nuclease N-terminal domain-containing protein n=1 Tax=Winogradskyella alexanderae TaxID=2877123 RepID=A0ABS7XW00_9FLAO|nr:PLD nuclease N-terminal domain-containing protein [Winogradskyella alexanderae]MCA0133598.1 PLD nuclease N-terminal domain-containing protein [Winogradskyella alexanderae]